MALADRIAYEAKEREAAAVFIDSGGGAGVIDRLRQLGHCVTEVNFGGRPGNPERYRNRRIEMWTRLRDWLREGGVIPKDDALRAELSTPTYFFEASGAMRLEVKDKIKERLLRSPERADALALTFALPVAAPDVALRAKRAREYDPLEW